MLHHLPAETVLEIAKHLSFRELLAFFSSCSKLWAHFGSSFVWITLLKNLRTEAPLSCSPHIQLESLSVPSLRDLAKRTTSIRENWRRNSPRITSIKTNVIGHRRIELLVLMPGSNIIALLNTNDSCLTFLHVPSGARSNSVFVGLSIAVASEAVFENGHYFIVLCTNEIEGGSVSMRLLRIHPALGIDSVEEIFCTVLPIMLKADKLDLHYRENKVAYVAATLGRDQLEFVVYNIKTGTHIEKYLKAETEVEHILTWWLGGSIFLINVVNNTHRALYWIDDHHLLTNKPGPIIPTKTVITRIPSEFLLEGMEIDHTMPSLPEYGIKCIEAWWLEGAGYEVTGWTDLIGQLRFTFVPMPKSLCGAYLDTPCYVDVPRIALSPDFSIPGEERGFDVLMRGSETMVAAIIADETGKPSLISVHPRKFTDGPGDAIIKYLEIPSLELKDISAIDIDERMGAIHLLDYKGILHSVMYN